MVTNDEQRKCEHCGATLGVHYTAVEADEGTHYFCRDCWDAGWRVCYDCGHVHQNHELHSGEGVRVCDECFDNMTESWNRCAQCDEPIDPEDDDHTFETYRGSTYHFCQGCIDDGWSVCYECGHISRYNNEHPTAYGEHICDNCLGELYTRCEDCGEWVLNDDSVYSEEDDAYYCDWCYRHNGHDCVNFVRGYHSSPHCYRDFIKNGSWLYLGVEIEMGGCDYESDVNDASHYIHDNFADKFHMENDCSIDGYGFETISVPMTFTQWQKYREKMADLYDTFASHGMKDDESCGLHIHVSKNYLDSFSWKALQWFMFKNQDTFERIAGRRESFDYARYSPRYTDIDEVKNSSDAFFACYADARYRALNMTNNRTVEFRLFAAQPNVEKFYEKLSIVNYLVRWVKYDKLAVFHLIETPRRAFNTFIEYVSNYDAELAKTLATYNNGGK